MKLEWFNLMIGIAWIVLGIIIYIRQKDIILSILFFVAGIVFSCVKVNKSKNYLSKAKKK